MDSESQIRNFKEQIRLEFDTKQDLEIQLSQCNRENDSNRRALHNAEMRYNEVCKEKSALSSEVCTCMYACFTQTYMHTTYKHTFILHIYLHA